ncbi:acyl-CoA dehydrogenase family protein [Thauera sinica]|uniref:acyl-CoA dehydrogenase family protein n=1 Tax=Thauera sp. K11 TaxID=2005884 RepID=UPI000BBA4CF0|nr:acyl-CoA dehydrogenase family protein [Thauera sp. K11]ATE58792.1 hypothetical protein CCZ27_01420 [Thauera sp. K11]
MAETYDPPVDELRFVLDASAPWHRVLALPAFAHVDEALVSAILEEGARFCAGVLAPINHPGDEQGCVLDDGQVRVPAVFREAYAAFVKGGWAGVDLPEEVGGQALPTTLAVAFSEMVNGACVAFGMMACMVRAGAHLILEHGEPAMARRIAHELLNGEAGATIVITEPQAGSDVSAIRTRAVPESDGEGRTIALPDPRFSLPAPTRTTRGRSTTSCWRGLQAGKPVPGSRCSSCPSARRMSQRCRLRRPTACRCWGSRRKWG